MDTYVPLHVHTTYSTLDSCIRIKDLADRLVELGLPGCAVTEHGNLYSLVEVHSEFQKKGLRHLKAIEAYITQDPDDLENKNRKNSHLVLIARNQKGLENLIWLSTQSHLHNFYYKPRIWVEHLKDHSEGLIACSACLASVAGRMLRWEPSIQKAFIDDYNDFIYILSWFREVFKGEYYLEIQDHDFWQQIEYNRIIIDIARKHKFPLVITSDAHYIKKEDQYLHEMMMALQFKKTLEEYRESDEMKYGASNYITSPDEMNAAAKKWECPDAIENTIAIAEKCEDIDLHLGQQYFMPSFDVKNSSDYKEFCEWREKKGVVNG
jgi:DNA polymerase-3 subunit alpha